MTQTLSRNVAAAIRAEAARRRVTQTDLAQLLGLSQAALSRRFSGIVPFEIDELPVISEALGVSLTDLLKDTPPTPGGSPAAGSHPATAPSAQAG